MRLARSLGCALLLGACGSGSDSGLRVDVRTDFVPGLEFAEVRVDAAGFTRSFAASASDNFVAGERVAEFDEALAAQVQVRVALFTPRGDLLIERVADAALQGATNVTIRLSRSCLNVRCPAASNPAATECDNGLCVEPDCFGDCTDAACATASECPTIDEPCGEVVCNAGACVFETRTDVCAEGASCIPGTGCVDRDTGAPPDAGPMDAAPIDTGVDSGPTCVPDEPCELEGNPACERGVTECSSGESVCVSAGPVEAGTVCRPSNGECDAEEVCDGVAPRCPEDVAVDVGTSCGEGGFCNGFMCGSCETDAPCTPDDSPCATGRTVCDAEGRPSCVVDELLDSSVVCRVSAGPCDVEERCSGASPLCPADGFAGGVQQCRPSVGPCDVAEFCPGSGPACPADTFRAAGFECRSQNGACDQAERCTGSGAACPTDGFRSGDVCRPAAGDCDVAETCSGSSASCPPNGFRSSSTTCRASAGPCDVAEMCTGSNANCPANGFQNAAVTCRPSAGGCDISESCTGTSAACPSDARRPSGFVCRGSAGDCDVAETCNGSSTACPSNGFLSGGTQCRAARGDCDLPATCSGSSASCPANPFRPSTHVCRSASGICDVAETCTGSSFGCPADGDQPNGTSCGADQCGAFGSCTTVACNSGTRTRECRPRECNNGSCQLGAPFNNSQSCTPANGTSCTFCLGGTCGGGFTNCVGTCFNGCCNAF